MPYSWRSGLFDGKPSSMKEGHPRSRHRDDHRHRDSKTDGYHRHQLWRHSDETQYDHRHRHGYSESGRPTAQSSHAAPGFNQASPPAPPAHGYYHNGLILPRVPRNGQVPRNWPAQTAAAPVGWSGQHGRTSYPQNKYYHGHQLPGAVNGYPYNGSAYQAGSIPHGPQTFDHHSVWSRPDFWSSCQLATLGSRGGEYTCSAGRSKINRLTSSLRQLRGS